MNKYESRAKAARRVSATRRARSKTPSFANDLKHLRIVSPSGRYRLESATDGLVAWFTVKDCVTNAEEWRSPAFDLERGTESQVAAIVAQTERKCLELEKLS